MGNSEENDFTRILTSDTDATVPPIKRQESWYMRNDRPITGPEEIDCPSCRGSGITEQSDNELVALIPYTEEVFQPRRLKLKISLAICVCAVIIGISFMVLYPGRVTFYISNVTLTSANITLHARTTEVVLTANLTVENKNVFLPIALANVNLTLKPAWCAQNSRVYNLTVTPNTTVASKQVKLFSFNLTTTKYNTDYLRRCCCSNLYVDQHCKFLFYESFLNIKYQMRIFNSFTYFTGFSTSSSYFSVNCRYFDQPSLQTPCTTAPCITCKKFD